MHHAVWLWNRMGSHITGDMMPYECITGDKPGLMDLKEWGCKVWHPTTTVEQNIVWDTSVLEPANDELPPSWLIDLFSGSTEDEEVTLDVGDAASSQGLKPADLTYDGTLSIEPVPAVESNDAAHVPAPAMPTMQDTDVNAPAAPLAPPVTPPCTGTQSMPVAPPDASRAHWNLQPSRYMRMLDSGTGSTMGLLHMPALPRGMQRLHHPLNFDLPGSENEDEAVLFSDASGPNAMRQMGWLAEWPQWEAAIQDELGQMEKMKTWELTEKPSEANLVRSKWVFKIKRDASGAISKYKARLMAQGFSQIPGINFTKTFAPVAKLLSLHIIAALAMHFNWELHQMDVKNAYLNGDLEEEIYMKQPPVFQPLGKTTKPNSNITIVAISVDDLTIATISTAQMMRVKARLNEHFEMTDLGFNLQDAKLLTTPLDPSFPLTAGQPPSTPHEFEDMQNVPYHEAISSLMYVVLGTHPDITYSVTVLSQFMQNLSPEHWEAAKRVMHYLKSTKQEWLTYGGAGRTSIEAYMDADWGSNDHHHSISGYVFLIDRGVVSWSIKKQSIVALSSTKAEYVAMMQDP
ncbi:hypothetical protein EWM64_g7858 [Hericium alpestre]|uniref:Reverse transcriptase Ty1/copia-type domain-containing protein n=1 Tax=Hericium alpestre TaxID=135208 RepID=A0A4Y9ZPG5_9AGAM|nr:hypothetical protein EWM64_g7858 [Hericium alpestre]